MPRSFSIVSVQSPCAEEGHSISVQRETNSNWGTMFCWWDKLHRTLRRDIPQDEITIGVAAYRDEAGGLHTCSAACTHLGCHLRWNSFERCWDCPCHGSQFSIDGAVLNAPAIFPLEKVSVDSEEKRNKAQAG